MKSNEQTELTSKTETLIDGKLMTASGQAGGRIEQNREKTHRQGQQVDDL